MTIVHAASRLRLEASPVYTKVRELLVSMYKAQGITNARDLKTCVNNSIGDLVKRQRRSLDALEQFMQQDASTATWRKLLAFDTSVLPKAAKEALDTISDHLDGSNLEASAEVLLQADASPTQGYARAVEQRAAPKFSYAQLKLDLPDLAKKQGFKSSSIMSSSNESYLSLAMTYGVVPFNLTLRFQNGKLVKAEFDCSEESLDNDQRMLLDSGTQEPEMEGSLADLAARANDLSKDAKERIKSYKQLSVSAEHFAEAYAAFGKLLKTIKV